MKKKYLIFLSLFFAACNGSEEIVKHPVVDNKYDPSMPVSVDCIKPTYGGIDVPFVIEGNFKGDLSNMKVYFGEKKAILITTDGKTILGLVPKQGPGRNQVSVVIGNDSIVPEDMKFKYQQTKSVITIAGQFGYNPDDGYVDGDLNVARFKEASNIATVKGEKSDNVIVVESWWNNRVSLLSLDDNKVVTLDQTKSFGTPAVDNTREKFYLLSHWVEDRTIYSYSREESYAPKSTNIVISAADMPGQIWSGAFTEKDNRYLYLMDSQANFARVDLQEYSYQVIPLQGDLPSDFRDRSLITYSKYHKCFFAAFYQMNGIYKIYEDNGVWKSVKYAGFNGAGSTTGHRLLDAQFTEPYGIAVTSEGEIYVLNRAGAFINKIVGDQVELVAGKPGNGGQVNSATEPLDARFDSPQDIAVDSEGNFYIAGGWDRVVRKLSIE